MKSSVFTITENKSEFSWFRAKVQNTYGRMDRGANSDRQRIDAVYGKGSFRRKKVYYDEVANEKRTTFEIYGI